MGHGGMSCGMKTIRFVMVLFNVLFFLIGLALLALGIYVMVDPSLQKLKQVLPINSDPGVEKGLSYLEVMGIVIIVLGSVLLLIGFFGCCGAMKQVKLFLAIYAIIVGIIILFEIAITIYFVAFKSKFREQITPKLKDSIRDLYEGPVGLMNNTLPKPSAVSVAWDFIMLNFKCCGVDSKLDFNGTKIWNRANPWWTSGMDRALQNFTYPLTCCDIGTINTDWNNLPFDKLQSAVYCAVNGTNIRNEGCYDKFMDLIDTAKTWIIVGAVVILVIELTAFIFALGLCCRKKKDTMYYSS